MHQKTTRGRYGSHPEVRQVRAMRTSLQRSSAVDPESMWLSRSQLQHLDDLAVVQGKMAGCLVCTTTPQLWESRPDEIRIFYEAQHPTPFQTHLTSKMSQIRGSQSSRMQTTQRMKLLSCRMITYLCQRPRSALRNKAKLDNLSSSRTTEVSLTRKMRLHSHEIPVGPLPLWGQLTRTLLQTAIGEATRTHAIWVGIHFLRSTLPTTFMIEPFR